MHEGLGHDKDLEQKHKKSCKKNLLKLEKTVCDITTTA